MNTINNTNYFYFKISLLFFILLFMNCNKKDKLKISTLDPISIVQKNETDEMSSKSTEFQSDEITSTEKRVDISQNIEQKIKSIEIIPGKIYEEAEVTSAIIHQSNEEALEFSIKHFKFPDPNPLPTVDGKIVTDLVIETDGSISNVIIVEGLHPELDEETIRVFKLLPKFTPGKIDGQPVRSKYRMVMRIKTAE